MPNIGIPELLFVCLIALLLFGKRLPEVMRNLGKGITEFKRGVAGIDEETNRASQNQYSPSNYSNTQYSEPARPLPSEERQEATAPKFQPPTSAPSEPSSRR